MRQSAVASHFDLIAPRYDKYKKKNPYYYSALKNTLKDLVPPGKRIFDFGCGTGEILAHLSPSFGVGYDISPKMVEIARKKFKSNKNLRFVTQLNAISGPFDFLLMIDVVEHLKDPQRALRSLKGFMDNKSFLVLSFVDSSWEPILWIMEKLGLKMPEGPHRRLSQKEVIRMAEKEKYQMVKRQNIRLFKFLPVSPVTFLIFKAIG